MGLQTGSRLAATKRPIIDPGNLKIIAYELDGPLLTERPSFILTSDIRELSDIGMIVDSSDDFFGINDVISVQKVINLGFELLGIAVIDESGRKLGKVQDYSLETDGYIIQQLNVKPGIVKSLTDTRLLIHRSQIVEINNSSIIVRSAATKLDPIDQPDKLSCINPFRSPALQTNESSKDL
jgi:sporulation protein YlmC with PRC-barrel domain